MVMSITTDDCSKIGFCVFLSGPLFSSSWTSTFPLFTCSHPGLVGLIHRCVPDATAIYGSLRLGSEIRLSPVDNCAALAYVFAELLTYIHLYFVTWALLIRGVKKAQKIQKVCKSAGAMWGIFWLACAWSWALPVMQTMSVHPLIVQYHDRGST